MTQHWNATHAAPMAGKPSRAADLALLCTLSLAANALLLLNPHGLYFEDMKLLNRSASEIAAFFSNSAVLYEKYLLVFLHSALPLTHWRAAGFLCGLGSTLALYMTLECIPRISAVQRRMVCFFFAAAPLCMARISVLLISRSLVLLAFFLASWSLAHSLRGGGLRFRLLALALFALALEFTAIHPFYLLAVTCLILFTCWDGQCLPAETVLLRLLKHADFFLLLGVSFLAKRTLAAPAGIYADHYKLSLASLASAALKTPDFMASTLAGLLDTANLASASAPLILLALGLAAGTQLLRPFRADSPAGEKPLFLLLAGLSFMFCAIFPYLAAGRPVLYTEWESRNQYLLPLGVSLVLSGLIGNLRSGRTQNAVACFLLAYFLLVGNITWAGFYRDWVKQQAFAALAANNTLVLQNDAFFAYDRCSFSNALGREINPFEHYTLLKQRIGDGKTRPFYSMGATHTASFYGPWLDYDIHARPRNVQVCEIKSTRPISITDGSLFRLMLAELAGSREFESLASAHFSLAVYPLGDLFLHE